jgi:hypothetical protein
MTGGILSRRLARLEASAGIGLGALPLVFVRFVRPDRNDPPAISATVNGQVWRRAPGGAEESFRGRVEAEARPLRPGCGVVAFLA